MSILVLAVSLASAATVIGPQQVLAATFVVTKTVDTNDGACNSDCSLREAISAANANPGADIITLPSGTYELTIANVGGTNEDSNATGDLDVNDSLTINGVGSGSTIIEAGTNNSNGIDKVFALNPICTSPIDVTIDSVAIRYGYNSQPYGAVDFSYTGGGIDWCANGSGSTFTLSNSVVSDNTNVNAYGGGLNVDSSNATNFAVNITNDTFQNNRTLTTVNTGTGGAINLFGSGLTVNVTNSIFTSNSTTNATSGGGAIFFRPTTNSSLSVSGSTFSSNTAPGIGGAIATATYGAGTTVSIQNSQFTGNKATNSFGGALDLDSTNPNTTPFSLSHLTITNNTAGISGGGVYVGNSNVSMSNSLIVGNSAPTGSGIHKSVDAATATVINNWWGCSTGPEAAPCDVATTSGGTLNFTPWHRDQLTATTSPIVTNQSTALTASFLTNSASSIVTASDVAEIIGRSVTWAATHGNVSSAQSTVQSAGTATGSFQATSAGTAVISAKVDNDNTSPISSNVLSLTVNKANTTTAITNGASLSSTDSVTGQSVTVNFSVTGAFGNSPTAPSGSVTVSDGTQSCSGSINASGDGSCSVAFATAGSKSLTATYAGDGNFNGSSSTPAIAHTVNKADTTTTISSDSPDPSVVGQSVTVQYSVTANSPGGGIPTGNVTVSDGTTSCTGTIAAGQCLLTSPSAGAKTLSATYVGDANYNGSTSATEAHQVNKADTTTAITSDSPDPSDIAQSVTVNYSVAVSSPGSGTPTGNVTVSDGVDSCTGTVAAGTCSLALNTPGSHALSATYASDSNFNGSTSAGEPHTVNKIVTTTSITSDNNDPSVVGESVTVQYSVSATSGTPTGNVTVTDGTISCTATVAAGQCVLTFTSAGAKSLTATYAGDTTYETSTSGAEPHQVNLADSTTTITSDNPDPSDIGQSVTVNYVVSVINPGAGTPTGNVTVSDGVDNCTGTVASGSCSITLSTLGSRTLTATYVGDSNVNGSTSTGEPHTVNMINTTTSITSDDNDPSVVGESVTVQYSVSATSGTPTGNVTVTDGIISCTATVAAGQCSLTFTSTGVRSLSATYAGDANYNGSSSATEAHQVNKADTTTAISSDSPDPSDVGQSVTVNYSVSVNSPGAGIPTGNVTVSDGLDSCTGTVAADTCAITLSTSGARTLTATYGGDSNFNGGLSAGESHTVNAIATTTTITSDSPDPSAVGQSVTVQFSVSTSSGTPTGNVTVSDGTISCTGTVSAGQCALTFTSAGAKSLTASYAGDSTYAGSTSAVEPHQVNQADTTTTINSDNPDPSMGGQSVTVVYNVLVTSPGVGTPTGNVTVSDGTVSCTNTVAAGQCALVINTDGTHNLTAVYAGDSNFNGSTSVVEPHTVDAIPPDVSINQAPGQSDSTSNSPIHFTAVFSEPVSGLSDGDVIVNSTAGTTTVSVTEVAPNDGTTFDVAVSGMNADGTVSVSIPANVATDEVGNGNTASTSTDNTVTFVLDGTPPDTIISDQPTNPTGSTSASFSFSGSDNRTPADSLTFECDLDGGGFASCVSPQSYSGLDLGSHTFQVRAIDAAGNVDPTPVSYTWEIHAATTLVYNGAKIITVGQSFQPAALLTSSVPVCVNGQPISFSLDRNPINGIVGTYALGTAMASGGGQATLGAVNTTGWQKGSYALTAAFAGTSNCDSASNQATVSVGSPGALAMGSGTYTLGGSGSVSFRFTVYRASFICLTNCSFKGQLDLTNAGKWRLTGNLTSYIKSSAHDGAASGNGDLYWWDGSLNSGAGGWLLAQKGVSYTITLYDGGLFGWTSTDKFGINIAYTPVSPPQPGTLPNSTPQTLTRGDISAF